MISKFILYGGFDPENTEKNNDSFHSEILKNSPERSKILIVPFSKELDRIIPTTKRVEKEINKVKGNKVLAFEVATIDSFLDQIKIADVVYFQGGNTQKLLQTLSAFPNLKEYLANNKIIAGDSAGAKVLCAYFYSPRTKKIDEGLSVIPLKIIPHYKEEYSDVFKDIRPDLENVFLKEYEFRVI